MISLRKSFNIASKYSIKWDNYFEIYENLLVNFRNKKIVFVEVGIGNGGSLFMWRKYFGKKARIIGIELNPEARILERDGFEIFIGDQSDPNFWNYFFKKVGKIDILIDDGGHTNIQQVTTLFETLKYIKNEGLIIIEDTHTSFMKNKGFKNPSKFSFINFTINLIEVIHRRNPMVLKDSNFFSKKIFSIEYFDSITAIKIGKKKLGNSKNLENNKKLRVLFDDFRYRRKITDSNKDINENFISFLFNKMVSKRSYLYRIYENFLIRKYIDKIKK